MIIIQNCDYNVNYNFTNDEMLTGGVNSYRVIINFESFSYQLRMVRIEGE